MTGCLVEGIDLPLVGVMGLELERQLLVSLLVGLANNILHDLWPSVVRFRVDLSSPSVL